MLKSFTFTSEQIREAGKNLCLVILLMFIAFGQIPTIISEGEIVRPFIFIEVPAFTVFYIVAFFWNIYRLVPRLLFRGKYLAYAGALFGLAVIFVLAEILFNWARLRIYERPAGNYGYFSDSSIPILDLTSNLLCVFICFIATSLIALLRQWQKSGKRIHELEEVGVRLELDKTRNKIDSDALFNVLDKSASIAVSSPQDASSMLLELSKSLRRQLYESEHKNVFPALTEKTEHTFGEQYRLLNFLTEKRYRLARNFLLMIVVCLIASANTNPDTPSFPI